MMLTVAAPVFKVRPLVIANVFPEFTVSVTEPPPFEPKVREEQVVVPPALMLGCCPE
jgi:hypothetical protein